MSLINQEQLLFDLLFDNDTRANYIANAEAVFANYELDEKEREDFSTIRIEALELDANMRNQLLLSTISHSYPASFSLVSALPTGIELLRGVVDAELMRTPPLQRVTVYGQRLCEQLKSLILPEESLRNAIIAVAEVETGMAWTAAALKQRTISGKEIPAIPAVLPENWTTIPMRLADYVSVAMLPVSYNRLLQQVAGKQDIDAWSRVSKKPLAPSRLSRVLKPQNTTLIVAQARLLHASVCEPGTTHQTLELSEGFAHLFQHISSKPSVEQLLEALKKAGAPAALTQSVRAGFEQLFSEGMLIPA